MRDSDRAKVYAAEQHVRMLLETPGTPIQMLGTCVVTPDERKFGQVSDIQGYVDKVIEHVGYPYPCTVRVRKGTTKAHYEPAGAVIAIPETDRWAMREIVVLHELAHHMDTSRYDRPWNAEYQAHGPEFRKTFCDLAESVLAPEARFLLQMAFWDQGLSA